MTLVFARASLFGHLFFIHTLIGGSLLGALGSYIGVRRYVKI